METLVQTGDALGPGVIAAIAEVDRAASPSDASAQNRRSEPRFSTDRLTSLHFTGPTKVQKILCRILDYSESGMRIRTQNPLEPGLQVRVTLREMVAVATVRYCVPAGDGFDHGIKVEEIRSAA